MGKATFDYSDKAILVTGGGSGIGAAMARAFAKAGGQVAVADINPEAAEKSVEAIRVGGGRAEAFLVDVGNEESVKKLVASVVGKFGGIDVALNNAGIEANVVPLADLDSANWQRVSDVNLSSVFYCMKAQIPVMIARGGGAILNTASISGVIAGYNLAAYTATKHGVIGITRATAVDYARANVRVNALCPGLVDTPFIGALPQNIRDRLIFSIPMDRPAQADEMAQAALWLCSDGASYVTGHAMVVDGGASLGATGTRFDDLM